MAKKSKQTKETELAKSNRWCELRHAAYQARDIYGTAASDYADAVLKGVSANGLWNALQQDPRIKPSDDPVVFTMALADYFYRAKYEESLDATREPMNGANPSATSKGFPF